MLVMTGCAAGGGGDVAWQDPAYQLSWPLPPDPPRIRYLRQLTGAGDFVEPGRSSGVFRWLLGESREDLPLLTPFAVAVGSDGVVWVADNGARMFYRIDLGRKRVDYLQEIDGVRLTSPGGVAIDEARGRVYLADAEQEVVFVVDRKGEFITRLSAPGGMKRPAGLAVDSAGRLYVADVLDGTVAVFDDQGRFVTRRGSAATADGRFGRPLSVAIGPHGEVLVVDALGFLVEVQSAGGELLASIGSLGDSPGHFSRPRGVAVDPRGHVFVTDAAFDNVQVFDMAGRLLMHFGQAGSGAGQFNLPAGVCVDPGGRLFVADGYNHRVQVFEILGGSD